MNNQNRYHTLQQQNVEEENSKDENTPHSHNIFFANLTKFMSLMKDRKSNKNISNDEVKPFVANDMQIQSIIEKLEVYLSKNQKDFQPTDFKLFKIYLYTTGYIFLKGFLFSVIQEILFGFGIILLDISTNMFKEFSGSLNEKITLSLILLGIVANYTIRNLLHVQFEWLKYQWQALCKTVLSYLLYKKSLKIKNFTKLSNIQLKQNSTDQNKKNKKDEDEGEDFEGFDDTNPNINNLLTVDISESEDLFWGISQFTSSVTVILITLGFIYHKIGNSIMNGIYILIGSMLIINIAGWLMNICIDKMLQAKDKRISLSKDIIEGIKSIKYLGWENIFSKKIQNLRNKEFRAITGMRILDGILTLAFLSLSYLLLYAFIGSFIQDGNNLKDSNVLTIIALFGNLSFPLSILPATVGSISKAKISFVRIKQFLNQHEINQSNGKQHFQYHSLSIFSSNKLVITSNDDRQRLDPYAICMNDLKFQWPNRESGIQRREQKSMKDSSISNTNIFTLRVDQLEIEIGSLNLVIGQIGSGKTAFLLSILNEMELIGNLEDNSQNDITQDGNNSIPMNDFQNKIIVNGNIGYVSQNHWLQSKTVRENILFGQSYQEKFYNKCLELCQLKEDISKFQQNDSKIISSDGNNLSGGQRQRISLCRALYQNKDIYLLDDIFSSLDAHVADLIFQNVILDYLIKQMKKTVLLVTNNYSYLNDKQVNQIIYLNNGCLINKQDEIQAYIKSSISYSTPNFQLNGEQNNQNTTQQKQMNEYFKDYTGNEEKDQEKQYQLNENTNGTEQDENEDGTNQEEENREKGQIKMETFNEYFKSQSYLFLFLQILFLSLSQSMALLIDYWLKDQLIEDKDHDPFLFLNKLFSGFLQTFLFLTFIYFIVTLIASTFYVTTSLLSSYRLFNKLNESIMFSKLVFFDHNPVGRIINRLSDDVNKIDDKLQLFFEVTLEKLLSVFGNMAGIIIQLPWMSLFFIISLAISYLITNVYRQVNREIIRLDSINKGQLLNHISESSSGFVTVRSMSKQSYMITLFKQNLDNSITSYLIQFSMQMWMFVRLLLISNAVQLVIVITSILYIFISEELDSSVILLCLTYGILFSGSICNAVNFICSTEKEMISVERVRQYFSNQQEDIEQISQFNQLSNDTLDKIVHDHKEQQYSIIFKNISITYDNLSTSETLDTQSVHFALKNFNLKIKKGEKVAFCGRTGSGKTSVFNCLYRLYDYQQGSILINSTDIQHISLKELRQSMAIIPQFGFLYNATLRENIDPLQEQSDTLIKQLISSLTTKTGDISQKSHLFDEMNFQIQEGGKNLSNGQKQIINFIRAALRKADIICLDEATSNMDPSTDKLIHEKLFEISEGKTLLVITHRLENIQKFDRIIVLDSGEIVENGSYEELRQIKEGYFNKLILKNQI